MKRKVETKVQFYKLAATALLAIFFAYGGLANAEQSAGAAQIKKQEPLIITLTAKKVVLGANKKETFSSADKVKPGDMVEYRAQYVNVSKAVIKGVVATLPVPKSMEYVKDSARPALVSATLDGKLYEAAPLKRNIKDKAGKEVIQLVPLAEYRGLSWSLGEIQAGKSLTVSARMQVSK